MSTARDVIIACLAVPRPEGHGGISEQADLIVAALIEHGHLPNPVPPRKPTREDYEETAKWLADASRHPRYSGDGWVKVLQSEADVEMASAQADLRAGPGDRATIAGARALLLEYVTRPVTG